MTAVDRSWWVSWYQPAGTAYTLYWPWWVSGYRTDDDARTVVAAIRAATEGDAMAAVIAAQDEPFDLEWRFVEEVADPEWSPYNDRFPQADWMRWPEEAPPVTAADAARQDDTGEVERLCEVLHDAYEEAAEASGWVTQARSRKPWTRVPSENQAATRAGVRAVLRALPAPASDAALARVLALCDEADADGPADEAWPWRGAVTTADVRAAIEGRQA